MGVIGNADTNENNTEATVRIAPDLVDSRKAFTVITECDIMESGMGARSNTCKIVVKVLNVPVGKVSITKPSSRFNPPNYGFRDSRGTITTGKAVSLTVVEAKRKTLELGTLYFKHFVDQLDTKDFIIYVRDNSQPTVPMFKLALKELSIVGYRKYVEMFSIPSCTAVLVGMKVDPETGSTKLVKMAGGIDVGQVANSRVVEM